MLFISNQVRIPDQEIEITAIRSQGAGGQNVNKVASAIHLRFNIHLSSLPAVLKKRLLNLSDHRITTEGIIVIKAQQFRSQDQNRADAIRRLKNLIQSILITQKKRRPTKPSRNSRVKRMENKTRKGKIKTLRRQVQIIP